MNLCFLDIIYFGKTISLNLSWKLDKFFITLSAELKIVKLIGLQKL